jgi:hypothetical protein
VTIRREVPNIRSDRPAETRDFFVDLFGFEVAMDMGWVMTVASPSNPSAQITIVGGDDMSAPGISVEDGRLQRRRSGCPSPAPVVSPAARLTAPDAMPAGEPDMA